MTAPRDPIEAPAPVVVWAQRWSDFVSVVENSGLSQTERHRLIDTAHAAAEACFGLGEVTARDGRSSDPIEAPHHTQEMIMLRARLTIARWDIKNWVADWIARHLPRSVVYYAAIRVAAYATTGRWSDQVIPELTIMDAVQRWDSEARD